MKNIYTFLIFLISLGFIVSCGEKQTATSEATNESTKPESNSGQAFIKDDQSKPNALQIAIGSKDHTTLVAAVQAAGVENALSNVGPLTVFAPINQAFEALPAGVVEDLLKPENKAKLTEILVYHVTPGNLSVDIIKKLKKLGQANNQDLQVNVEGDVLTLGPNKAKIVASIPSGNGIVHVIDQVLLPSEK